MLDGSRLVTITSTNRHLNCINQTSSSDPQVLITFHYLLLSLLSITFFPLSNSLSNIFILLYCHSIIDNNPNSFTFYCNHIFLKYLYCLSMSIYIYIYIYLIIYIYIYVYVYICNYIFVVFLFTFFINTDHSVSFHSNPPQGIYQQEPQLALPSELVATPSQRSELPEPATRTCYQTT